MAALPFFSVTIFSYSFFLLILAALAQNNSLSKDDIHLLEFPLNLEYMEAEFFSWGAFGVGLDELAPELVSLGGPRPVGVKYAKLDKFTRDIVAQFAYQEFGHLRAIQSTVKGFARPLMNLSAESFANVMNRAFETELKPTFDPYNSTMTYLLAAYLIPYIGLTGYVGANPLLTTATSKRLVAGLLGVESGQDAVIRTLLYKEATAKVEPYNFTVAEFTNRISKLRDNLGREGVKDEGLRVDKKDGAEGKISGNVLAGDKNSVAFARTPEEILRIVYASGNETIPGGFFPNGANGFIASSHLNKH